MDQAALRYVSPSRLVPAREVASGKLYELEAGQVEDGAFGSLPTSSDEPGQVRDGDPDAI